MNPGNLIFSFLMFWGVGLVVYLLSLKFNMKHYGAQPLLWRSDLWLVVVALLSPLVFDTLVFPLLVSAIRAIPNFVTSVEHALLNGSAVLRLSLYFVLSDLGYYWLHRFLHSRFAWNFHALHHSPKSLNILSGMRGSMVHHMCSFLPYSVVSYLVLIDLGPAPAIFKLLVDFAGQHMTHSNIAIPGAKYIEYVFVTPRMHFVHHHPNERFTNTNYGVLFSIWDRMFGTYQDADKIPGNEAGQLGLDYELDMLSLFTGYNFTERVYPPGKSERPESKSA